MKKVIKLKYTFRLIILFATGTLVLGSIYPASTPNVKEVQYRLIFHNFLEPKYYADLGMHYSEANPDTASVFFDLTNIDIRTLEAGKEYVIRPIETSFYSAPGYLDNYLEDIIGLRSNSKDFEVEFFKEIGVKPYKKTLITANNSEWHFWSGEAIEKVFNKYYGNPSNKFQQATYGFIYDVGAKKYMRDYVKILNYLLVDKKKEWLSACNNYYTKAMNDSDFSALGESDYIAHKMLGNKEKFHFIAIDTNSLYKPFGELIRRQIDGSLPSITKCIRKILKDYDPETLDLLRVE
jgi:hypothetical protein